MSRTRPGGRMWRFAVPLAVVAGLSLAACAAGTPAPSRSAPLPSPSTPSPSPSVSSGSGVVEPLTGLVGGVGGSAVVVVVSGGGVVGLGSADVVFEEVTVPGPRFLGVFQSRLVSVVGPVGGTRPVDGGLVSVLDPLVGYEGGTAVFVKILHGWRVRDVGAGVFPGLYGVRGGGVFVSVRALARRGRVVVPPELFRYRGAGSGEESLASVGVSRPSSVVVRFGGAGGRQVWVFDGRSGRWVLSSGGPRVSVANVVVQSVVYREAVESRKFGVVVPSARVMGSGRVVVLSGGSGGGVAASGLWSKPNAGDVTNYLDGDGFPMAFEPGSTWVDLAPPGTRVSMGSSPGTGH